MFWLRESANASTYPTEDSPQKHQEHLSPLKPTTVEKEEEVRAHEVNPDKDGFVTPWKGTRRGNFISKEEIFKNIKSFLDGFMEEGSTQRN